MNQNDFSSALETATASQLPPLPDMHAMVNQMIHRDRRRTRVLAFFTLLFWLIAMAGMLVLLFGLNRFVLFVRISPQTSWNSAPATQPFFGQRDLMLWGTSFIHHSIPYLCGCVVASMFAALCTVLLIFSSRRGVLNRINFSLAQISEQLKQIRAGEQISQ